MIAKVGVCTRPAGRWHENGVTEELEHGNSLVLAFAARRLAQPA